MNLTTNPKDKYLSLAMLYSKVDQFRILDPRRAKAEVLAFGVGMSGHLSMYHKPSWDCTGNWVASGLVDANVALWCENCDFLSH